MAGSYMESLLHSAMVKRWNLSQDSCPWHFTVGPIYGHCMIRI